MTPIAHLIGSVPLKSADEVFRKVSQSIGQHVKGCQMVRQDAGPIGSASYAASWQNSAFERDESVPWFQFKQWDGKVIRMALLKIINGTDHSSIQLEKDMPKMPSSFSQFRRFKPRSSQTVKYQACSATPMPSVIYILRLKIRRLSRHIHGPSY